MAENKSITKSLDNLQHKQFVLKNNVIFFEYYCYASIKLYLRKNLTL